MFGKLLTEKWYDNLGLVSDDAPQFKLYEFVHDLIPLTTQLIAKSNQFFVPAETTMD